MEVFKQESLRGPRPPELVCPRCDVTIEKIFNNPILEWSKKHNRYDGETTGGSALCDTCFKAVEEEQKKPVTAPKIIDCPLALLDATFDNYAVDASNRAAVDRVRLWVDTAKNIGKDLFLFGPTGTGKTRLSITAARAAQVTTRYARVPALMRQLRDSFRDGAEAFDTSAIVRVPLLILDDLGAEKPTAFSMQTLETLYTERLDAGRRTIFTSNLPIADHKGYARTLVDQLDDARFISRLFGTSEQVELAGVDRRLL